MIWILIVVLNGGDSLGAVSAEFNSQQACKHAGEQVRTEGSGRLTRVRYVCVKKGEK